MQGGLGTLVREAVAEAGVGVPVRTHGLRDEFALIGPPTHLYSYYGLNPDGIATIVRRAADESGAPLWSDDDRRRVLDAYATRS